MWRTTLDVAEFLDAAGGFLSRERARNTVLLTVAETIRENPRRYGDGGGDPDMAPLFGWRAADGNAADGTAARAAFLHTPPHPVLLSVMTDGAAAELAGQALPARRPVNGVNGNPGAAGAFAAAWRDRTGAGATERTRNRLYRLGTLLPPDPAPPGAPRLATEADIATAAGWFTAFAREAHGDAPGHGDQTAAVADRLSYGGLTLWEDGGVPVSMAGLTRQVAGMVRVDGVYTPPRLRGRGYASAVTAAVSETALAGGAEEVLLYTDLANPVSNSIYQRIGYQPVEDRVELSFGKV